MSIQEKIKIIENAGLSFGFSDCHRDSSFGSISSNLLKRGLINSEMVNKIISIGKTTNFWDYYIYDKPLNSQSILFINLVYNIIDKHEKQKI